MYLLKKNRIFEALKIFKTKCIQLSVVLNKNRRENRGRRRGRFPKSQQGRKKLLLKEE